MSTINPGLPVNMGNIDGSATNLTPDALMVYLQSRLNDLDGAINDVFARQQKTQAIRSTLNKFKSYMSKLAQDPNNKGKDLTQDGLMEDIKKFGRALKDLDPELGKAFMASMRDKLLGNANNDVYNTTQLENTVQHVDDTIGDLDATSQMDMIRMQSMMSSRQTAISLSTNLISSLGQSTNKIADNVGR